MDRSDPQKGLTLPKTNRQEARALPYRLRRPSVSDGAEIWRMVKASSLDTNSPYAYLMWFRYFGETSVVAEADGKLVGFVAGFAPPARSDTRFVWQVCVDPSMRGRGLARAMLDELAARPGEEPARYLEATVTPSNAASLALFRGFAAARGVVCHESDCFGDELFPGGGHEPELLLQIGPLPLEGQAAPPTQETNHAHHQ